jgi:hypothetical protein
MIPPMNLEKGEMVPTIMIHFEVLSSIETFNRYDSLG